MDVIVKVETRTQRFSVGTDPDTPFNFSLDASNGFHVQKSSTETSVTFRDVPDGEYIATVEKLGVSGSVAVTVEGPTEPSEGPDIEVPVSVTVTVEAPASNAPAKAAAARSKGK